MSRRADGEGGMCTDHWLAYSNIPIGEAEVALLKVCAHRCCRSYAFCFLMTDFEVTCRRVCLYR